MEIFHLKINFNNLNVFNIKKYKSNKNNH
jgi:hypothetical protein